MRRCLGLVVLLATILAPIAGHVARADILGHLLAPGSSAGRAPKPGPTPAAPVGPTPFADTPIGEPMGEAMDLAAVLTTAVATLPALAEAKIDVEIANAAASVAAATTDWQVSADLQFSSSAGSIGGFAVNRQTTITLQGAVSRLLSTGGTMAFGAGTKVDDTDSELGTSREWTDNLTASIDQPLLRGRGRAITFVARRRAALDLRTAAVAQRQVLVQTIGDIVSAYWDLAEAQAQAAISRAAVDRARERLRLTTAGIEAGQVARSEAGAVAQSIVTRQEDILVAELAITQASLTLRRAAGLPIDAEHLALRVTADLELPGRTYGFADQVARAEQQSPELQRLLIDTTRSGLDIELAEDGLLPSLGFALSLGPIGHGSRATQAAKNLARFDDYAVSGRLTYAAPVGGRAALAQRRLAQAQASRIHLVDRDVRAQLAQAVAIALANLDVAARRVALSEQAIELAKTNVENELRRFQLGAATNFDVLARLDERTAAELRRVSALADWHRAEMSLWAVTGDVVENHGVNVAVSPITPNVP